MADIVETLRETRVVWKHNGITYLDLDDLGLLFQAADEIERLRNQVRQLETERDQWIRQAIGRD
jgi:hypothetical protein